MFVVCAFCRIAVPIPHLPPGSRASCPRCSHALEVPPLAAPDGVGDLPTRLTSPHKCHQCGAAIATPAGRHRGTIACPRCRDRASVYAVLHHCPRCEALLESPARRVGMAARCPACGMSQEIPEDFLRRGPGLVGADGFGFACPCCDGPLEAYRDEVDRLAACRYCLMPIRVPRWGDPIASGLPEPTPEAPAPDRRESPGRVATTRCGSCGMEIPRRVASCPYCGGRPG
jgi:DNA-directed RNA polymerase subunit RPC12/RpoP